MKRILQEQPRKSGNTVFQIISLSVAMETSGPIWLNFELIQAFMHVLIACKYEKDQMKNSGELDLMFMKHYAPNRCLHIKVAKLRTGVGSAEMSYLQNCSVKLFKEHFKVQICKGRLFEKNQITFFSNFHQLISLSSSIS